MRWPFWPVYGSLIVDVASKAEADTGLLQLLTWQGASTYPARVVVFWSDPKLSRSSVPRGY